MQKRFLAGVLACATVLAAPWARAAGATGPSPMPEELRDYFAQAMAAEKLDDPVARCRAYPDLPGNAWPANAGPGRCMLQQPLALSLAEMERLLDGPGGAAALDARLKALLEAHHEDPEQREQIFNAYYQIGTDERSGRLVTRWLRAAPDSAFAQAAMGRYRAGQGWEARGGAYMADTSKAQQRRMGQHFAAAVPLLVRAMEAEPMLSPACTELAAIGRQSSDALQRMALGQCLERDPLSFYVVRELAIASMPKWGGSMQGMEAAAGYIHEHGARNPSLYVQLGQLLSYEGTQGKTYKEARGAYEEAAHVSPDAEILEGAARGQDEEHRWRALMYLSQALRFQPGKTRLRDLRATWWLNQQQWSWAELDLAWLVETGAADARIHHNLGTALLQQNRYSEAQEHYRAALAMPDTPGDTQVWLCAAVVYDRSATVEHEMRECTARLLAEQPRNPQYWGWRFAALAFLEDRAGLQEALGRFRKVADLDDPRQAEMLRGVTMMLKAVE